MFQQQLESGTLNDLVGQSKDNKSEQRAQFQNFRNPENLFEN